jgi:hypothetical protein
MDDMKIRKEFSGIFLSSIFLSFNRAAIAGRTDGKKIEGKKINPLSIFLPSIFLPTFGLCRKRIVQDWSHEA